MTDIKAVPDQPVSEGQPVPINAMFEGDFVTQFALVLDTDTIDELAQKVAAQVVGRRQRPRDAGFVVSVEGRVLPSQITVAEAGIQPLDNVFVGWAES
ncbi:MAG: toluene monooxygenase [Actinobacteria bacterium]|nr:toluene monooxygenase [Actinomycetota bacterium]